MDTDCTVVEDDLFAQCDLGAGDNCSVPQGCALQQPTPTFDPPQIVLVLDKSGSMFDPDFDYDHDANPGTPDVSRWNGLHVAVSTVLGLFDAKINFGLKLFPSNTSCAVTSGVDEPCLSNNAGPILGRMPAAGASLDGGTPSESALDESDAYLDTLAGTGGPRAMIFMSDGQTTCTGETAAEAETIISNALSDGIPTYVVAINSNSISLENEMTGFANQGGNALVPQAGSIFWGPDGFETGNFSVGGYTTGGNASWFASTNDASAGVYSAQSGNINDFGVSDMYMNVDFPADGWVVFDHKESTEEYYDELQVLVDGGLRGVWSGITGWQSGGVPVTAGLHTITFRYFKDYSVSEGDDTVWVDNIQLVTGGYYGPAYFNGQDTDTLVGAMDSIISSTIVCELALGVAPPYPGQVDVQVQGTQYGRIDPSVGGFDCTATDGWYYTNELTTCNATYTSPPSPPNACVSITLCGQACVDFKAMTTPSADVEYFCASG